VLSYLSCRSENVSLSSCLQISAFGLVDKFLLCSRCEFSSRRFRELPPDNLFRDRLLHRSSFCPWSGVSRFGSFSDFLHRWRLSFPARERCAPDLIFVVAKSRFFISAPGRCLCCSFPLSAARVVLALGRSEVLSSARLFPLAEFTGLTS
jgi:hypothetical protein